MANSTVVFENTGEVEITNIACDVEIVGSQAESVIFTVADLGGNQGCDIGGAFNISNVSIPSILPGTSVTIEALNIAEGYSDIVVTATKPTMDQTLNGPDNDVLSGTHIFNLPN